MGRITAYLRNLVGRPRVTFRLETAAERNATIERQRLSLQLALQLRAALLPHRQPVNYEDLVSLHQPEILLLGELHGSTAVGGELSQALPQLRERGFYRLGLEVFSTENQADLDRFYYNGNSEIFAVLRRRLAKVPPRSREDLFKEYHGLLSTCRRDGVRPLGLDVPEKVKKKTPPERSEAVRESGMAEVLSRQGRGTLALLGSLHITPDRLPRLLEGLKVLTLNYVTNNPPLPNGIGTRTLPAIEQVEKIARAQGLAAERFMLADLDRQLWGADVIVHLPSGK